MSDNSETTDPLVDRIDEALIAMLEISSDPMANTRVMAYWIAKGVRDLEDTTP